MLGGFLPNRSGCRRNVQYHNFQPPTMHRETAAILIKLLILQLETTRTASRSFKSKSTQVTCPSAWNVNVTVETQFSLGYMNSLK